MTGCIVILLVGEEQEQKRTQRDVVKRRIDDEMAKKYTVTVE